MPTLQQLWLVLRVLIDLQKRFRPLRTLQFDLRVGERSLLEFIDEALELGSRDRSTSGTRIVAGIEEERRELVAMQGLLDLQGRRPGPTIDLTRTMNVAALEDRPPATAARSRSQMIRRVLLLSIQESLQGPRQSYDQAVDPRSFASDDSVAAEVISQPRKPPPRERYANAVLLDRRTRKRLDAAVSLKPGQSLVLRLDIGRLSHSHVIGPVPFPEQRVQRDIDLDVMVSSSDFELSGSGANGNVAHGAFLLPGDGSPATSPTNTRFLRFALRAPKEAGRAFCRISYYYRNALLQSQQLVASVGKPGGFRIETDFTASDNLTNLHAIPDRPRISVLTNANAAGVHQIVLRRQGDAASDSAEGYTFEIKHDVVKATIAKLRSGLEARAPTTMRRKVRDLENDLRVAAPLGWSLYVQIPAQRTHELQPAFEDPEAYVIQIVRPTTSSFVFPWAFIYDIPLLTDRPEVCKLVSDWDGVKPLITGSPRQCPHGPHVENVLCPFGFWGFRYRMEQLASSDRRVATLPASHVRNFVVAEAQYGIDPAVLATHVTKLRTALAGAYPKAQVVEGKTKEKIRELLGQDLTLAYFFCHGERANVASADTYLGVGAREKLSADEFIGWIVSWQRRNIKIWNDVRPLIFVNACHSLAIYPETLASYVDAFVGTAHAAGVIGTEIKVDARIAADVAERFFDGILKGEDVETALRQVRFDYLAQGNMFGLAYTPYCWADLHIDRTAAKQQ